MDYLLTTTLEAIKSEKPEMASWLEDKAREYKDANRLEVLRWVAGSLDSENRRIVERALGVCECDLDAVQRVLQKV